MTLQSTLRHESQVNQLRIERNIDSFVNSRFCVVLSFRRKPESSKANRFWMPDQVRHDDQESFYKFINIDAKGEL